MIPRIGNFFRQYKRSAFTLAAQLNTRKFGGKVFILKVYNEIICSLFFPQESFRYTQHTLVYIAGFFNLRYLGKR